MDIKSFLKQLVQQYFVIYTGSMFGTFFFCKALVPEAKFGLDYFLWMMIFSLMAEIPMVAFYTKKELTRRQWEIRTIIHFFLLELILMTAGGMAEMYHGIYQAFWFAVTILGVYVLVRFVTYLLDVNTADQLNQKLQERRKVS